MPQWDEKCVVSPPRSLLDPIEGPYPFTPESDVMAGELIVSTPRPSLKICFSLYSPVISCKIRQRTFITFQKQVT